MTTKGRGESNGADRETIKQTRQQAQ